MQSVFHGNDKQNNWQSVKCLPEKWCDMMWYEKAIVYGKYNIRVKIKNDIYLISSKSNILKYTFCIIIVNEWTVEHYFNDTTSNNTKVPL